jgi:hypothetical protein
LLPSILECRAPSCRLDPLDRHTARANFNEVRFEKVRQLTPVLAIGGNPVLVMKLLSGVDAKSRSGGFIRAALDCR